MPGSLRGQSYPSARVRRLHIVDVMSVRALANFLKSKVAPSGRLPITPLGQGVGVLGVLSYAAGWGFGWIEFFMIAVGLLAALLLAIPFVVGGRELRLDRTITPDRVRVGEQASSVLTVTNTGSTPSAPRVIEDRIGPSGIRLDVPSIPAGASTTSVVSLPTSRRGVVDVGPAIITRADPLGLLRVDLGRTPRERLWVHPRYDALATANAGFAKDLEGPTFDSSPAGDVSFHTIREYQRGDDVRYIHWMSTARAGTLMVRHFVDNRRPHLAVLVDDRTTSMGPEEFEVAIEIAASHIVSAILDGRPVAAWVGNQQIVSSASPADRQTSLDRLCLSEQREDADDPVAVHRRLHRVDPDASTLVFVTGASDAPDLLSIVLEAAPHSRVIVVRIAPSGGSPLTVPRATVINADSLDAFAAAWQGLVAA